MSGWGHSSSASARACRPERLSEVSTLLNEVGPNGIIPFAAGRSYGDAALNEGGQVLLTERLNRLITFDEHTGELVCEPGVTFDDLIRTFLRRGYLPPVTPGTAYATIGGAVANDVHGKNHERAGSFGDHVSWIDLMTPDNEMRRVAPRSNLELFEATIGGIGLTGIITQVCFRMQRTPSSQVRVWEQRIPDLDAFLDAFRGPSSEATYSVGWIDGLARGASLGRGLLCTAEPAPDAEPVARPKRAKSVPFWLPNGVVNPFSVGLFNSAYYKRIPACGRSRILPLPEFLYPLDAVLNWNRIYGSRGFYQFQCVIPTAATEVGIPHLVELVSASRAASFLAVIKMLGHEGRGHLSFAMPGCTLALDFPRTQASRELIDNLGRITLDYGGRVYLAKDATLSAESFARMYPKLDRFRAVLEAIDPAARFNSNMARRLGIRQAA